MPYHMNYGSKGGPSGNPNNNAKSGGYGGNGSMAGNPNNNMYGTGGEAYGMLPNRYAGNAYGSMKGYGMPGKGKGLASTENRKAKAMMEGKGAVLSDYMTGKSNYDNKPGKNY